MIHGQLYKDTLLHGPDLLFVWNKRQMDWYSKILLLLVVCGRSV